MSDTFFSRQVGRFRALQRLRAIAFTTDHAKTLAVDKGEAGLLIERRGYLRDGRAIEFTQSCIGGDAHDFVAQPIDG